MPNDIRSKSNWFNPYPTYTFTVFLAWEGVIVHLIVILMRGVRLRFRILFFRAQAVYKEAWFGWCDCEGRHIIDSFSLSSLSATATACRGWNSPINNAPSSQLSIFFQSPLSMEYVLMKKSRALLQRVNTTNMQSKLEQMWGWPIDHNNSDNHMATLIQAMISLLLYKG